MVGVSIAGGKRARGSALTSGVAAYCPWGTVCRGRNAKHCAESPRQVQGPNPGNHMPDARGQFAADDRRPHAIPHRMARVLRLLPDAARANEPGSLDPPENAF